MVIVLLYVTCWSQGIEIIQPDAAGDTPLILAKKLRHHWAIQEFLKFKPNTAGQDLKGNTTLHFASWLGYSIAKGPSKFKKKIDLKNREGKTPLLIPVETGICYGFECIL